jgi:hypothetical protein
MTDQEEFDKARRRLYAIADRMGMRLTIIVRRKSNASAPEQPNTRAPQRQPGDE